MKTHPKQFVAAKAFIRYGDKLLVVRESATHPNNNHVGKYDIIGGRIEYGETVRDALMREVKEECGLTVTVGQPFFVNQSFNTIHGEECQIIRIFFRCTSTNDSVVLNEEHDQFKWIDPKNYQQENVIENLYPVFEAYVKIK